MHMSFTPRRCKSPGMQPVVLANVTGPEGSPSSDVWSSPLARERFRNRTKMTRNHTLIKLSGSFFVSMQFDHFCLWSFFDFVEIHVKDVYCGKIKALKCFSCFLLNRLIIWGGKRDVFHVYFSVHDVFEHVGLVSVWLMTEKWGGGAWAKQNK